MSLKKCKECGLMVSSEAKTCPHCGVKLKKSIWRIPLIIIFSVVGGLFLLQPFITKTREEISRTLEETRGILGSTATNVKKKNIEDTVKSGLTEEIGVLCISVTLIEESKNNFVGDAKLEDGRELQVTATAEGGYVRYRYLTKQGYEYKCKHHIDQVSLRFNESKTYGTLSGRVWNDESHPIRG
ncbi:unnamed protein product, partial [marine sediment metagenome]